MIGDSESDMTAAAKAGVKGIKIVSNSNMLASIANLIS
jgi:phosphoglycolate phosphatase-like HAD superfamily hydrolase